MINETRLITKKNYATDRKIICGSMIHEYDIRHANISVLYSAEKINDYQYTMLEKCDKITREITIGKMIRDNPKISPNIISDGINTAKIKLQDSCGFSDSQIVRIANDAVYIENQLPYYNTSYDIYNNGKYVEFVNKGFYTSYITFSNGITILFKRLKNSCFDMDVKGINDKFIEGGFHQKILGFLGEMLSFLEMGEYNIAYNTFREFYANYINRELDIEFYREFCASSSFRLLTASPLTNGVLSPTIISPSITVNMIDIKYNLGILRELYSCLNMLS